MSKGEGRLQCPLFQGVILLAVPLYADQQNYVKSHALVGRVGRGTGQGQSVKQ